MKPRLVIALAVWATVTACNGCLGCPSIVDQPGSTLPRSCDENPDPPLPQKLDVLFVVDNSGSMAEEQEGVASEMTSFVSSLRVAGGVKQDLRVGVITTTVYFNYDLDGGTLYDCTHYFTEWCYQSGMLRVVPGSNPPERVLSSDDPQLVPKFQQLIHQGTSGSGQETPFEALRRAFSPPLIDTPNTARDGGNAGFLRDGARLLIVVLSDEDDCSENHPPKVKIGGRTEVDYCRDQANLLTPVSDYYDFLTSLKDSQGNRREIIYTAIAPVSIATKAAMGVLDPLGDGGQQIRNIDCPTSNEPGFRHRQMAEMFFSDLSNLDSICKGALDGGYKQTLLDIAALAGVSQTLELNGVSDEHTLQVVIDRVNGSQQTCTVDNGGITFEPPMRLDDGGITTGRLHFESTCKRRRDDLDLEIKRLCVY